MRELASVSSFVSLIKLITGNIRYMCEEKKTLSTCFFTWLFTYLLLKCSEASHVSVITDHHSKREIEAHAPPSLISFFFFRLDSQLVHSISKKKNKSRRI
jgi:hypothetical protein